jgi:dUTP pyrophosphatase
VIATSMQMKIQDEDMFPHLGSSKAAGYDLRACLEEGKPIVIRPGDVYMMPTGVKINIQDDNTAALILPRSGLGSRGLVLANGTGLIDADYHGELVVALLNRSQDVFKISRGERIAQLVFFQTAMPTEVEVLGWGDEFATTTERGENGFGSTGTA